MCGITGIIGKKKLSSALLGKVAEACDSIRHRGPDSQGNFGNDYWALGHTRLSVIDTSSEANQPMSINNGKLVIVYNGEIYNHNEIRSDLIKKGISFNTSSDTETLLQAYSVYGKNVLHMLNGFFAFCIYDQLENEFFIARDRFGIKPLHYSIQEDYFVFASEIKSLLKFPINRELNYHALGTYLQLSYIPAPNSIYKSVQKLLPGQSISILADGELKFENYYSIKKRIRPNQLGFDSAASQVKQLTMESVERRLISDVPLGSFLSGGVDSSIIAYCANQYKPVDTFTISFKNEPMYDESHYARMVSKHIKSNHHEFEITNTELLEIQSESQKNMDEPFADSSSIAFGALAKFTKNHVTVALSGDGADELFSGYNKHAALFMSMQGGLKHKAIQKASPLFRLIKEGRDSKTTNLARKIKKYVDGAELSLNDRYFYWAKFTSAEKAKGLLKNFQEIDQNYLMSEVNDFNDILYNDFNLVLQNDMLKKVDSMSMLNSLEVRTPFLDHQLVEYVFSLPSAFKINSNGSKLLLKEAFRKELPPEIFARKKHGFEVPLVKWFKGPLQTNLINLLLDRERIEEQGIFQFDAISSLFKQNLSQNQDTIWALLQFQLWYYRHNQ